MLHIVPPTENWGILASLKTVYIKHLRVKEYSLSNHISQRMIFFIDRKYRSICYFRIQFLNNPENCQFMLRLYARRILINMTMKCLLLTSSLPRVTRMTQMLAEHSFWADTFTVETLI